MASIPGDDMSPQNPSPQSESLTDAGKPHLAMPAETLISNENGNTILPQRLGTDYHLAIRGGLSAPLLNRY